jgi:hypothetical protein
MVVQCGEVKNDRVGTWDAPSSTCLVGGSKEGGSKEGGSKENR